jgi:1-acyl-sn-glycerol-3-phosphate acyltransferase
VGTNIAQPIGRRIPKVMRIGIVIGEPLDFSRYKGMESDRFILRSVTDEIMYALMSLSGQEYVDVYAATQKARIASGHVQPAEPKQPGAAAPGGRPAPEVHVPVPPEDDATPSVG